MAGADAPVPPGALAGLRVLDLSRVLADLGADVVKVERPGGGDDTRAWGPPWVARDDGSASDESAYFVSANRNKRSLTVDLGLPEGQRLVRDLALRADVLIENFKVGGLARYALDFETLKALNPRLIYCSITGFGQTGPYAERPGYDFLIQGMGGLMSVTGRPEGEPGGGPLKVGVALTDVMTGLYASVAVLAALQRRHASGVGQHIDLALLDVQVAALANQASNFLVGGQVPQRMGNAHPNIVPYQDFPTADGHMIVTVGNDSQFASFSATLGCPEWARDERFATNAQRVQHRDALVALIRAITVTRSTDAWVAAMEAANVPCGPINTIDRVFAQPQLQSRGMQVDMAHAVTATLPLVANPIRLSESPVDYRRAPPTLGQHTDDVLDDWLALDAAAIAALRSRDVV